MFFIEKKKKKNTEKTTNYLKWRSVLPVSSIICKPDFLCFSWCAPLTYIALHEYFSLGKTSGTITKVAGSEVLF